LNAERRVRDLLRELAPQVLGTLVRRHGQFDACEDGVQEALLAAALIDKWHSEGSRRRREQTVAARDPAGRDPAGRGAAGGEAAARECYLRAARMTSSLPEQRNLALRAARLHPTTPPADPAGRPGHPASGPV